MDEDALIELMIGPPINSEELEAARRKLFEEVEQEWQARQEYEAVRDKGREKADLKRRVGLPRPRVDDPKNG